MIFKIFSVVSNVDSFLVSAVIKNATKVYTHIYMCFLHTHTEVIVLISRKHFINKSSSISISGFFLVDHRGKNVAQKKS